jgi:drug/metabolite transporter (DMT)-like permease
VRRLGENAHLLLALAVTFWAGNFLIGRAVRADVPPVALAFGRWALATAILAPFAARAAWRQRHVLARSGGVVLILSATGVTAFNTLIYLGLQTTTALNAFLLQAAMPVAIVAMGAVLFGERTGVRQAAGLGLSLLGAVWVIAEGRPGRLLALEATIGDLLVGVAVLAYAVYSVMLRRRPAVAGVPFAFTTFLVGTILLAPFWAWEHAVRPFEPNATALAALAYVAVFPSILSYLAFNRGVALLGSARAGVYLHLMPVLGGLGAVALLGERFAAFHAVGVVAVAGGIALAAGRRRRGGGGAASSG